MALDSLPDDWFGLDDDETCPVRMVPDGKDGQADAGDDAPAGGDGAVGGRCMPETAPANAEAEQAPCALSGPGRCPVAPGVDELIAGDLRDRALAGADLRGADLTARDLGGADLSDARLDGACLRGADLTGADLRGARLCGADLSGARLCRARMTGADLSGAVLFQADLQGARLAEADVTNCTLAEANLTGLVLPDARLSHADLARADLRGAQLTRTRLDGAQMYGASLAGAELYGADISSADLGSADLSGADLSAANLRGADLRGADLLGTRLCRADLRGADLRYATIAGVWLLRPSGNPGESAGRLTPADLRHADLRGAQLRGVTIAPDTRVEGALLGRCPLCPDEAAIYDELLAVRTLAAQHVSYSACAAVYRQLAEAHRAGGLERQAAALRLRQLHCLRRDGVLRGLWPWRRRDQGAVASAGGRLPAPLTVLGWSAAAVVLFAFLHGWAGLSLGSGQGALLVGPGIGPLAPTAGVLQGFAAALYYSLVCFIGVGSPAMQPATWLGLGLAAVEGVVGLTAAVVLVASLLRRSGG